MQQRGNAGQSNYVASVLRLKALLEHWPMNLHLEQSLTVSPGFIDTAIFQPVDKSRLDLTLKRIPAGRAGDSSEIADLVFSII